MLTGQQTAPIPNHSNATTALRSKSTAACGDSGLLSNAMPHTTCPRIVRANTARDHSAAAPFPLLTVSDPAAVRLRAGPRSAEFCLFPHLGSKSCPTLPSHNLSTTTDEAKPPH